MDILQDFSLRDFNAFNIDVDAKYFASVDNIDDLRSIITNQDLKQEKMYFLGEGWNTLFTNDFNGLVVKVNLKGKKVIEESDSDVVLEVGAGEDWIKLVDFALENNWAGIENLSYVPGTVGAAPVQNIAAYGQNFDEVFVSLDAFDTNSGGVKTFSKEECKFGYRTSIFKTPEYKKYTITTVRIRLSKNSHINIEYHSRYGSIIDELKTFATEPYTIHDISKAVTSIRKRKFPDWENVGTAGSFFLNPVISKSKLKEIQIKLPNVQFYPVDKLTYPMPDDPTFIHADHVKIAAGWLLEELGWKGKRIGNVGTSPNQALVVINYGNATAQEILDFTNQMQESFKSAYGINLEPEVNVV